MVPVECRGRGGRDWGSLRRSRLRSCSCRLLLTFCVWVGVGGAGGLAEERSVRLRAIALLRDAQRALVRALHEGPGGTRRGSVIQQI